MRKRSSPIPTARRRRRSQQEIIVADVAGQIRGGLLAAGERLASFQELGEQYGVSQGVVAKAMAVLSEKGLVETQPRRGCFVASSPLDEDTDGQRLAPETATAGVTAQDRETARLAPFLEPQQAAVRHLTLYVSEILPTNLAVWEQVLDDFREQHRDSDMTVLSCRDGHVEDLAKDTRIDLVETRPAILAQLGGAFVAPPELDFVGVKEEDLLAIVRERMRDGEALHGVPFSVTLHYLFANADLLAEAGVCSGPPESPAELIARGVEADGILRANGADCRGLATASLVDYMILAGALQYRDGRLLYWPQRAFDVLKSFAHSGLTTMNSVDIPARFAAGKLAFMHHCSYETVALREPAAFDWRLLALPIPPDVRINAHLTVLALNRDTDYPQDALALMQHLCAEPAQLAFARQYGNVPALERAALHPEVVGSHPAGADGYRRTLERSCTLWPEDVIKALTECCTVDRYLNQGRISVDAALGRIRFALELAFGDNLDLINAPESIGDHDHDDRPETRA